MTFSYVRMTKEDAERNRYELLNKGQYKATVIDVKSRISASGNNMLELLLNIYSHGRLFTVKDYLVFTPKMQWKAIHFCESAGLLKEYEEGLFTPELSLNREVKIEIGVQEGNEIPEDKLNGRSKGEKYPPKNNVIDYLPHSLNEVSKKRSVEVKLDDDIPF
jgi:hypothetical protein